MTNRKLEILVVEDNPVHQQSAKEMLGEDYKLRIVSTFYAAYSALREFKPDVLLTDMNFPMDGEEYDLSTESYVRAKPSPLGDRLAFLAARPHIGVQRIAVYSDSNHHQGAVAETFDFMNIPYHERNFKDFSSGEEECYLAKMNYVPAFKVNDSRISFVTTDVIGREGQPKDWKALLELISQEPRKMKDLPNLPILKG